MAGALVLGAAPAAQPHGGDRFSGTFESNIRDNGGTVVFTARGTISGERIEV